jgi:hypothetical protein
MWLVHDWDIEVPQMRSQAALFAEMHGPLIRVTAVISLGFGDGVINRLLNVFGENEIMQTVRLDFNCSVIESSTTNLQYRSRPQLGHQSKFGTFTRLLNYG